MGSTTPRFNWNRAVRCDCRYDCSWAAQCSCSSKSSSRVRWRRAEERQKQQNIAFSSTTAAAAPASAQAAEGSKRRAVAARRGATPRRCVCTLRPQALWALLPPSQRRRLAPLVRQRRQRCRQIRRAVPAPREGQAGLRGANVVCGARQRRARRRRGFLRRRPCKVMATRTTAAVRNSLHNRSMVCPLYRYEFGRTRRVPPGTSARCQVASVTHPAVRRHVRFPGLAAAAAAASTLAVCVRRVERTCSQAHPFDAPPRQRTAPRCTARHRYRAPLGAARCRTTCSLALVKLPHECQPVGW